MKLLFPKSQGEKMTHTAIAELQATIRDITKMMTSDEVSAFTKDVQSILDDIEMLKLAEDDKANRVLAILAEDGANIDKIDKKRIIRFISDFKAGDSIGESKHSKSEAKYRFPDSTGTMRSWSGRGRKPQVLQALLDQGKSMEDYLAGKEA